MECFASILCLRLPRLLDGMTNNIDHTENGMRAASSRVNELYRQISGIKEGYPMFIYPIQTSALIWPLLFWSLF